MLMLGMSIVFEAQNEPEANSTLPMENLAVAGMPNSSTQLDPNPQWGTGIIYPCSIFVAKRSAQPDGHTRATWHPHNTYTSPSHIPTLRALPSSPLSGFSLFCSCFVAYCMIADVASGCIPMYYAFLYTVFSCIPDSYACKPVRFIPSVAVLPSPFAPNLCCASCSSVVSNKILCLNLETRIRRKPN